MNDALIVRVTGEENGQMRLEEIERRVIPATHGRHGRMVQLSPVVW